MFPGGGGQDGPFPLHGHTGGAERLRAPVRLLRQALARSDVVAAPARAALRAQLQPPTGLGGTDGPHRNGMDPSI